MSGTHIQKKNLRAEGPRWLWEAGTGVGTDLRRLGAAARCGAFESRGRCRQSVWDLGEGGAVRLGSRVKWSHLVVRAVEGVEGVFDVVLVVMGMAGGLLACLAILGAAQVNAIKWLWVTILNSVWSTSLSKLLFGYNKRWPKTWFEVVGLFANLETFPLIHSAFILSKSYETKFLIILKFGIWNSSPEFVCRLPKGQLGGKEKVKLPKSMKRISEFSQQMNSQSTKEDIAFVCFVQKPFESSRTFSVCRLTLSRLPCLGFFVLSCLLSSFFAVDRQRERPSLLFVLLQKTLHPTFFWKTTLNGYLSPEIPVC